MWLLVGQAEGGDDERVADRDLVRGGAVDANHAGAGFAREGVGDETLAIGDVPHMDLLELHDVHALHQRAVDRDTADVVQVGVGHARVVDFASQHAS